MVRSDRFFFNDPSPSQIYTLSLHDALPIFAPAHIAAAFRLLGRYEAVLGPAEDGGYWRSEEHTSELQSRLHLVCRLLLEKKKQTELPASLSHRKTRSF